MIQVPYTNRVDAPLGSISKKSVRNLGSEKISCKHKKNPYNCYEEKIFRKKSESTSFGILKAYTF